MKLHRLIINNVRGIRELDIKPDGDNFLIWGPNGSGKSGVIDSIDFLLTGQISRLMGRGTGGISLSSHGPHIDCDLDEAWVEGTFQIPENDGLVILKRSLRTPSILEYDEEIRESIEPILSLAQRGQHVLTRRDILRYIASDASTRAREIQELLNIREIENIRSSLVRVRTHFKNLNESSKKLIENSKGRVMSITQHESYAEVEILKFVNDKRK
jgi:DNA repair exonuclease SbcCD ATPase subunit